MTQVAVLAVPMRDLADTLFSAPDLCLAKPGCYKHLGERQQMGMLLPSASLYRHIHTLSLFTKKKEGILAFLHSHS